MIKIIIPAGTLFADLKLGRDEIGTTFDASVIQRVCEASDIHPLAVLTNEDAIADLIIHWYRAARLEGEPEDSIAEALLKEVISEPN